MDCADNQEDYKEDSMDCEDNPLDSSDYVPRNFSVGTQKVSPQSGKKYWIPNVDESIKPSKGMVFDTLNEAYRFYENYGKEGGFEVRKSTTKRGKINNIEFVRLRYFVCSREGFKAKPQVDNCVDINNLVFRGLKKKSEINSAKENKDGKKKYVKNQTRNRPSQRCGCRARICLELTAENKFALYEFVEKHNHILVHPEFKKHLRSNRKLNFSKKLFLKNLGDAGIGPSKGYKALTKMHGGHDNLGATEIECYNFKRDCTALIGQGDAQILVDMLNKKKECLPDFSFVYFTNGEELGGAFWADDQSKRNYYAFGDVVSFDATYRKNKYGMVFIPFTGIDNHMRSVTFGAALLSKEDVPSFTWLCNAFIRAFPREPQIVMTDQDPALKVAVKSTFVNAKHRLCMWHITEKFSAQVGVSICNDGFRADVSKIIWTDKIDPAVFETKWFRILDLYDLHGNKWLQRMFDLRQNWVPAFFRDWPMSSLMRTSSRSESTNHMFGQIMKATDTLVECYSHFETAMQSQRFIQSKKDYQSLYTTPDTAPGVKFEKDAVNFYTRTVFIEVQKEIRAASEYCLSREVSKDKGVKKFTIVDTSVESTDLDDKVDREADPNYFDALFPIYSQVTFNERDEEVSCSCKRYERFGLLCRHVFYVWRISHVKKFPQKYKCRRWMKDVVPTGNFHCGVELSLIGDKKEEVASVIREIYYKVDSCVSKLLSDPERLSMYLQIQKDLAEKTEDHVAEPGSSSKEFIGALLGLSKPDKIEVFPPKGIVNKGGGRKRGRITSSREESMKKSNKNPRLCAYCGKHAYHDIRNCPQKKKDLDAKDISPSDHADYSSDSDASNNSFDSASQ